MIIGTGVDLVAVQRIADSLARWGDRLGKKLLNAAEIRPEQPLTAAWLARQFAAKEAVSKALGTGLRGGVHFRDIKILRTQHGAPQVRLAGGARQRATQLGIKTIHLSISDESDYAIAFAVAEGL